MTRSLSRIQKAKAKKLKIRKIDVKLSALLDPNFQAALASLAQKDLDPKTAFAVADIIDQRQKSLKTFEEARKIIVAKYCDKDDKGEFLLDETKTKFAIKDVPAYDAEYGQLVDVEVEMCSIEKSALENLKALKPAEVLALRPLLK